jgi:choloylglycine hydrolase
MKRIALGLHLCLLGLLAANTAQPCTTFVMRGGERIYLGKNLDWDWDNGLVLINQRGVKKAAFVQPGNPPAQWTSKYGSVTFNQFGQEMPFGGMNEAGLVVENMWLDETRYPDKDSRPAINLLQWIQYQLDNCRTVEEVIATDAKVRVEAPPFFAQIHYLVCDASGDCASLECLDGKQVCHRGKDFPFHALANDTYDHALGYARAHPDPGTNSAPLANTGSDARFCRAAARVRTFQPGTPKDEVKYAFDTLEQVRQGDYTVWRIVYDVSGRQIHYRTRTNPQERTVSLKALEFACGHPVQCVDIEAKPSAAGVLEFKELTEASHREYLQGFSAQPSLKQKFGDLSMQVEGLVLTLRTYTCTGK